MVNWVGNNCSKLKVHCSKLKAFLFKGLKFKEFKSQQSTVNGQQSIGVGITAHGS